MYTTWKFLAATAAGASILALGAGAFASIPKKGEITNDAAIYENLSEIRVRKELNPDFDLDIARLTQLEPRYQENLPSLSGQPRLRSPIQRISQRKYRSNPVQAAPKNALR